MFAIGKSCLHSHFQLGNFWAEVGVVWLWRCQTDLVELELKMLQLLVLKLYECLLTKDLQMSLVCWWMVLCVLSWELG